MCWKILGRDFSNSDVETCSEFLLQRLVEEDKEKMVTIVTGLWGIWTARNLKVWENKQLNPDLAIQWSSKQVLQWREVQKGKSNNALVRVQQQQEASRWRPPNIGKVKINVDASVFPGKAEFSIGMIMRDHAGNFCQARNARKMGEVSVFEAEARGVLEALNWVLELEVSSVEVECDSLLTVNAIHRETPNLLEVGNILDECRELLRCRPDVCVVFAKKQANRVAHVLARVPCEANCFRDFHSPPHSVLESILSDAMLS